MKNLVNDESEYIKYATIALLNERDRKVYGRYNIEKRKAVCSFCGIVYYTNISKECPLCEAKRLFLAGVEKININDIHSSVNGVVRDRYSDNDLQEVQSKEMHNYKCGDVVKFGKIGGNTIEWIVVAIEGNRIMLISKDGLCFEPYNQTRRPVTWETSSIRKYLNAEFVEMCFDMHERKSILKTDVKNKGNMVCDTPGGNDTNDRIFLLSIDEAEKLPDNERLCVAFDNVNANGEHVDKKNDVSWWWLRSPGQRNEYAAYVGSNGAIVKGGSYIDNVRGTIRPALWVDGHELFSISVRLNSVKEIYKGDIITFGNYEGESIKWIVLISVKNKLLLLSERVLDFAPFNDDYKCVTWETSSLRKYLNGEFFDRIFSDEEKSKIERVIIKKDVKCKSDGVNDTTDRVFLLNVNEAKKLFDSDSDRIAFATEYAKKKCGNDMDLFVNSETGGVQWWLRSPGGSDSTAACVIGSGWIYDMGHGMTHTNIGIRPAIWINNG